MSELRFEAAGAEGPKRYFQALARERLSHAYLFSGPHGVGKKTFARRLAQSLLCSAPKDGILGYDGTCSSCVLFEAGENARHPDFLEHGGSLKIGSRDEAMGFYEGEGLTARDLVRQLSMTSYSGGMRVLLLGDVEFASAEAANALLKFLEEPPRGVLMILTTPSSGRLLPTIRSRTIELHFPLLGKDAVRDVLEKKGFAPAEAELAASLGGGSIARALSTLEGEEESLRASLARWFFTSAGGRTPEETWATRDTLDEGLETIKTLVRDWIAAAATGGKAAPLSSDYAEELGKLPVLAPQAAVDLLAKIDDASRMARTNVSPAMVGEIVRMALTDSAALTRNA